MAKKAYIGVKELVTTPLKSLESIDAFFGLTFNEQDFYFSSGSFRPTIFRGWDGYSVIHPEYPQEITVSIVNRSDDTRKVSISYSYQSPNSHNTGFYIRKDSPYSSGSKELAYSHSGESRNNSVSVDLSPGEGIIIGYEYSYIEKVWDEGGFAVENFYASISLIGYKDIAHPVKSMYIGAKGVPKKVKKAYIGVNGEAKLFFEDLN